MNADIQLVLQKMKSEIAVDERFKEFNDNIQALITVEMALASVIKAVLNTSQNLEKPEKVNVLGICGMLTETLAWILDYLLMEGVPENGQRQP